MRHGPAEDHAASGRDFDRALTASGRERVRDVARALVEADEEPLSSSSRARSFARFRRPRSWRGVVQLAEESGEAAGRGPARPRPRTATREALARKPLAGQGKRVMLVGHEPDLARARRTSLRSSLSGRRSRRPWSSGSDPQGRAVEAPARASASSSTRSRSSGPRHAPAPPHLSATPDARRAVRSRENRPEARCVQDSHNGGAGGAGPRVQVPELTSMKSASLTGLVASSKTPTGGRRWRLGARSA